MWQVAYFISKKIRYKSKTAFSAIISRIAIGSIAVGLATLLISSMIFQGFQSAIQDKIFALAGHIQIRKFDLRNSYDDVPISTNSVIYQEALEIPNVDHIQKYSQKASLLKTDDEVMGVVLKGVDSDFDRSRFEKQLSDGVIPNFGNDSTKLDLMVSQYIANKLQLTVGDEALIYFVQKPPRARKLHIKGIYETGIEEFDQQIVIGSNSLIQQLNSWGDTLSGGFEIFLKDFDKIDASFNQVYNEMDYDLQAEKVTDRYIHLFDWFLMVSQNVTIFVIILLFVACFNIISIVLILIMERIHMIGTLKALGALDTIIQRVFFLNGLRMVVKGLVIGNLIAFTFGVLQYHFKIIPLDPVNYYIDAVPIHFNWLLFGVFNILVAVLVGAVLLIPSLFIVKISPIQAIKFD